MIAIIGEEIYEQAKEDVVDIKTRMAEEAEAIKDEMGYSLKQISDEMRMNNFQVSYYLRNPDRAPASILLTILIRLRNMTDPRFEKREIKYVLHQTWVRPKNADPFFVNGATVASLYSVDLSECVLDVFATDEQNENCVHLEVTSK